jgi:hypothetical protein
VHCGEVKNGIFHEGRKLSVNGHAKTLKLINQRYLGDGSVLKKFERFSKQGVERYLTKDGQEIKARIHRFNRVNDAQNWLSMQPDPIRWWCSDYKGDGFGEVKERNKLHGRGI